MKSITSSLLSSSSSSSSSPQSLSSSSSSSSSSPPSSSSSSLLKNPYILVGIVIRLLFFVVGIIWDLLYQYQVLGVRLRYTDIDYDVFTDAATLTRLGAEYGPYERITYRYPPLLAFLLVPFITISSSSIGWHLGKFVFIICDVLSIYLTQLIVSTQNKKSLLSSIWIWLSVLNPIIINITTRGNADSLTNMLILLVIYLLKKRTAVSSLITLASGLVYGLLIHLRIYPIIYAVSFCFYIADIEYYNFIITIKSFWNCGFKTNNNGLRLRLLSLITFVSMTIISFLIFSVSSYMLYGEAYLESAFYYHIFRKDHRHNFSIYFYSIYLSYSNGSYASFLKLISFFPQITLMIAVAIHMARKDLCLCLFVQTVIFVAFNKVSTAQYFTWYQCLIPIVFSNAIEMKYSIYNRYFCYIIIFWLASLIYWLVTAYCLEMLGMNVFPQLFLGSLLLHISSVLFIIYIIFNTSNSIMLY